MDRWTRFGLITAVAAGLLLIPTMAASDTRPPVIEVYVSLAEMPPAIVNVSVPEQTPIVNLDIPSMPAPVVNVEVIVPEGQAKTETVIIQQEPQTVYVDREVIVEVEVAADPEPEPEPEPQPEPEPEPEPVVCDPTDGRERNFAFIEDGLIVNVAGGSGSDFEDFIEAVASMGAEITCVEPMPWIGWTFDGEVFAPPSD